MAGRLFPGRAAALLLWLIPGWRGRLPPGSASSTLPGGAEMCLFPQAAESLTERCSGWLSNMGHTFWPTSRAWFVLSVAWHEVKSLLFISEVTPIASKSSLSQKAGSTQIFRRRGYIDNDDDSCSVLSALCAWAHWIFITIHLHFMNEETEAQRS